MNRSDFSFSESRGVKFLSAALAVMLLWTTNVVGRGMEPHIQRGDFPGKGLWALPGGFLEQRERLFQGAMRELVEETRLAVLASSLADALVDVKVFDHPDRSLRGRTITHAHFFDLQTEHLPDVEADDDAAQARWVPIGQLAGMEDRFFDDHFHILNQFLGLTEN